MAHRLFSIDLLEVFSIALTAIRMNKLRSVLTLLGILVGVFSIIAVMTAVRVLQTGIESNLSMLGSHTFQIEKYPRTMGHQDRHRFRNRKDITFDQAMAVADRMTLAKNVGIEATRWGRVVKTSTIKTNPNVMLYGENLDGFATNNWNVEQGRLFSSYEYEQARKVVIIGQAVMTELFPRGGALGSQVSADGEWYTVNGILEKSWVNSQIVVLSGGPDSCKVQMLEILGGDEGHKACVRLP